MRHVPSTRSKLRPSRPSHTCFRPHLETLERRDLFAGDAFAFDWGIALGDDAGGRVVPQKMTTDVAGNLYVTGMVAKTVDFDPNRTHDGDADISTGTGRDVFVAKYAPDNTLFWVKRFAGDDPTSALINSDSGEDIVVDATGNVYVSGRINNNATFGPYTLTVAGNTDAFVVKLDSSGDVQWVRQKGGDQEDVGIELAIDGSGNLYAAYDTRKAPIPTAFYLPTTFAVVKYSPSGTQLWESRWTADPGCVLTAGGLETDAAGNVYVGGYYSGGSFDADPTSGSKRLTSQGGYSSFIVKMTGNGQFSWATQFTGTAGSSGAGVYLYALDVDSAGDVVVGGRTSGSIDFDAGRSVLKLPTTDSTGYIAKLKPDGNTQWVQPQTPNGVVYSLASDSANNIYAAGESRDPVTSDRDVFAVKLSPGGTSQWSATVGGPKDQATPHVVVDRNNNVYVSMNSYGEVDLDPTDGVYQPFNAVSNDGYLIKLSQPDLLRPTISVSSIRQYEGASKTTNFTFIVSLSSVSSQTITVNYVTQDGSAISNGKNADYKAATGTLTFLPGERTKTVTIAVNGNKTSEADENFFFKLGSATNADLLDMVALAWILNDD